MCPGQHLKTAVSLSKCFTAVIATILVFGTDTSYKLKWFWFLRTKTTGMIPWRRLRSQYPEPSQKFLGIATLNSLPVPVYAVPDNYYFYNLLLMVCGAQNKHSSWLVWCLYSNLFFYLNRLIMYKNVCLYMTWYFARLDSRIMYIICITDYKMFLSCVKFRPEIIIHGSLFHFSYI